MSTSTAPVDAFVAVDDPDLLCACWDGLALIDAGWRPRRSRIAYSAGSGVGSLAVATPGVRLPGTSNCKSKFIPGLSPLSPSYLRRSDQRALACAHTQGAALMSADVRPGAYKPAPITMRVFAAYRRRCTRCNILWRAGEPDLGIRGTSYGEPVSRRTAGGAAGGLSTRWLSEDEVADLTGLPGPLVAELLPRLPSPPGISYDRTAEMYPFESVLKAQIAVYMLEFGVRYPYIRAGMLEVLSTAELGQLLATWRQHHYSRAARNWPHSHAARFEPARCTRWLMVLRAAIGALRGRVKARSRLSVKGGHMLPQQAPHVIAHTIGSTPWLLRSCSSTALTPDMTRARKLAARAPAMTGATALIDLEGAC
jgi:hypothetical protein